MFFSVSDTGILGLKEHSRCFQQESNLCPSDALLLSYRKLVVARPLTYVHVTNILHTARIEMSLR